MITQLKNTIGLRPIFDLLPEKFFVPSYQRGYRWTVRQVNELLQDIEDFRDIAGKDDFYCLQPVVVKRTNAKKWEVIDGQQRLTTIYIILNYFNQRFAPEYRKDLFSISYETRLGSEDFLAKINVEERNKNIDYHFIYEAFIAVKDWFKGKQNTVNDFESMLLNRVKVIWYEVDEDTDNESLSIDIFTRINMGKIPLTNAELIKALFLSKSSIAKSDDQIKLKQLQIASEWDRIEYTLQNDEFWYFIHDNTRQYETRIDFIFDLMKEKKTGADDYYTFYEFNKEFKDKPDIDKVWKEVKDYFLKFEDWYNDAELYHMIGYLVSTGSDILNLKKEASVKNKPEFLKFLKKEISKKIPISLDELDFDDKQNVRNVLLLFNIQTLLDNNHSYIRFPFDRYKTEKWDIEHIRSRKTDIVSNEERRKWLKATLEYFSGKESLDDINDDLINSVGEEQKEYIQSIVKLLKVDKIADESFNSFYNRLLKYFEENTETEEDDQLSNLTLLDMSTNRTYKNAFFPVKRKKIIGKDKQGTFVPLCTKNVFLKYYSNKLDGMMYWCPKDATDYLNAIKNTLKEYLPTHK